MALRLAYSEPKKGVTFPDAYHRIGALQIDPIARRAQWQVMVYRDAATRSAQGSEPYTVRTLGCADEPAVVDPQTGAVTRPAVTDYTDSFGVAALSAADANPFKSAYALTKTTALYAGAVDLDP